MTQETPVVGQIFKSYGPITMTTERGKQTEQGIGKVKEVKGNKVIIEGLFYDFEITIASFYKNNMRKNVMYSGNN